MGQSTDAILAYGFALPDEVPYEVEWDDDYEGFEEEAEKRLKAAGITGVHITSHCSHDYPMYLLTTSSRTAWRGSPVIVDPRDMVAAPGADGWDDKLRAGMTLLGLTSEQSAPGWILCSDWS
ncbi:hypothetical protein [Streptomyces sp. NPDC006638]|uniref:hypothetical protein n=1 Tax=Streptomyces sp. NPDC006638 TaxID=3157183 RepID=UPI0033BADBDD